MQALTVGEYRQQANSEEKLPPPKCAFLKCLTAMGMYAQFSLASAVPGLSRIPCGAPQLLSQPIL